MQEGMVKEEVRPAHPCPFCDYAPKRRWELRRHLWMVHDLTELEAKEKAAEVDPRLRYETSFVRYEPAGSRYGAGAKAAK